MKRIVFVCHGNICRSPMAEFIFKNMLAERGLSDEFEVASRATSREEIICGGGNPIYPPAARELAKHRIPCNEKRAEQLQKSDYDRYDLIIGMDGMNMRNILKIVGADPKGKLRRLLDFTKTPREVADPWYTGDFERTYRDVTEGCLALLELLLAGKL